MFFHISIKQAARSCVLLLLSAVATAGIQSAAVALTFDEALRIAQTQAPQVVAREQALLAAQADLQQAAALPDPKLMLGVENVPIDGADRYSLTSEAMTMRRIGLSQEFPNSAKLDARAAAAQGRVTLAETQIQIARLAVTRETASAWIARASVEKQLARIDDLRAENRLFEAAIKAMLSGGKGTASDAVMPRQEAAMIDDRADELNARLEQAIAALTRWIGAAAREPLQGDAPDWSVTGATLVHGVHQHPELGEFDARARVLDAEIAQAKSEKRPDWEMQLAYQKRGDQYGDMASIQFSFGLPLFSGSRQDPKIAAKRAERNGLDAEHDATLREHAAMVEADVAEYKRLDNAERRQREVLLPLVAEKIALAMSAWRGGKGNLTDVIAARREHIDTELKIIELDGQRKQIAARLHYVTPEQSGAQP